MGVFSKWFGFRRKDWPVISTTIAKYLEVARSDQFNTIVATLQKLASDDHEIRVTNTQLGGKADVAMKALQLYSVVPFLVKRGYMSKKEVFDFQELLYADVCGPQIDECHEFLLCYIVPETDVGRQLYRFAGRVAEYITDSQAPLIEATVIMYGVLYFLNFTQVAVACAFSDDKTVKELEKNRAKIPETLAEMNSLLSSSGQEVSEEIKAVRRKMEAKQNW